MKRLTPALWMIFILFPAMAQNIEVKGKIISFISATERDFLMGIFLYRRL